VNPNFEGRAGRRQDPPGDCTIGAVLRHFLPGFLAARPRWPKRQRRILQRMALCRTGALGHTIAECSSCGQRAEIPLGCGDRHCPSCQASHARAWLDRQMQFLLPVPYYHVVFPLPHELHRLLRRNQAALYKLLFDSAAATLLEFARTRLHGTPGLTAILHTWGQRLNYHPHLHCLLTAGALSDDGQSWRRPKQRRYLFPEAAVSALFRGKFLAGLKKLGPSLRWPAGESMASLQPLYQKSWRVYLKRPFGGPEQTLRYLAHYTHRVAIANSRLRRIDQDQGTVCFAYRDYADGSQVKTLELTGEEFIRRFSLHLLPPRFSKIRHYGLLANNRKAQAVAQVRLLLHSLATVELLLRLQQPPKPPVPEPVCPLCHGGHWRIVAVCTPRGTHYLRTPFDSS
jgi:hypothetical protein